MSDARTLIDNLGGGTAIAEAVNQMLPAGDKPLDRENVYKWKEANAVPFRWRPFVARLAHARQLAMPPDIAMFAPRGEAA